MGRVKRLGEKTELSTTERGSTRQVEQLSEKQTTQGRQPLRWMPAVGALYVTIMLLGAATLGASSVFLRLTHPADVFGFTEIWIQMTCTLIAAAGIGAIMQQPWISKRIRRNG